MLSRVHLFALRGTSKGHRELKWEPEMGIEKRAQVDPWRYKINLGVQCLLGSPG